MNEIKGFAKKDRIDPWLGSTDGALAFKKQGATVVVVLPSMGFFQVLGWVSSH